MKIYKNKATKYHPAIEVESNEKTWKNLELTQSPTNKNRYVELKDNPNKNSSKKSYFRKYLRNDPIRTRGELLKKFNLSEADLTQIEVFLINNKKVSVKPTKLGLSRFYPTITNAIIISQIKNYSIKN